MARIRTIKPGFWKDEDLSSLPEFVHMLAAALLNYADDEGYFNANPKLVQAECCPLREPSMSIHGALNELSSIGYLRLGMGADGKRYGHILKFKEHQVISRPTASKINKIDISWEDSRSTHGALTENSTPEGKGKEGNKEKEIDLTSNLESEFEEWYETYPRHVGKGQARRAYKAARKKTDAQTLLEGIPRYRRSKPDYAEWKHPATWLNGECWLDEDASKGNGHDEGVPELTPEDKVMAHWRWGYVLGRELTAEERQRCEEKWGPQKGQSP